MSQETVRVGPCGCLSQWAIERTIGNLGEELKQPSNPFANLAQRGLRRCQTNALKAMVPDLDPPKTLPHGSIDLGNSYILLRAMDNTSRPVTPPEAAAINTYLRQVGEVEVNECDLRVVRWARLGLPTGQVARSAWKERLKPLDKVRMARNLKVSVFTTTSLLPRLNNHSSFNIIINSHLQKHSFISDIVLVRMCIPSHLSCCMVHQIDGF